MQMPVRIRCLFPLNRKFFSEIKNLLMKNRNFIIFKDSFLFVEKYRFRSKDCLHFGWNEFLFMME